MKLNKSQKRFLSRRECAWCDQTLDKDWCSAIFEKCSPEVRDKRRKNCLKTYKPRASLSHTPDVASGGSAAAKPRLLS